MEQIKLTNYSKGSGCGCKIAPAKLEEILKTNLILPDNKKLIVGNSTKDDAAVYDLENGMALISTVDFFTPIVDDAIDFGKIASANAISDVYAMGGKPLLAVAILGWPIEKLHTEIARKVIEGAKWICEQAGIPLAGGHSIDSQEPFFGLAVNGLVSRNNIKKNCTAKEGDLLYLTKPIGTGILSTAEKRGIAKPADVLASKTQMMELNKIGEAFGTLPYVHAMTDVTGFGLLGHLMEMVEGSGLQAEIKYVKVPQIEGLSHYTSQMCIPDNTFRNWNSYENKTVGITGDSLFIMCDPQTNGGLLVAIDPAKKGEFELFLKKENSEGRVTEIGVVKKRSRDKLVIISP